MTAKTAAKGGFTPGPWEVDGQTIRAGHPFTKYVAVVGNLDMSPATQQANARLIAAAPQMYAKLLDLSIKIDAASGQPSFTAKETDELNELLEAIHG